MNTAAQKTIKEICRKPPKHWVGDGFNVFPVFANKAFTSELSPFLMFDYAAPIQFPPSKKQSSSHRRGVGQHPHRGFETVTIAFQGEIEHADSTGKSGIIGPGDVQWMTAGRGIIHEEFHSTKFTQEGGILEMCQLWVNLPKKYKMNKPKYQPILKGDIPIVPLKVTKETVEDGSSTDVCTEEVESQAHAKIIAGELYGTKGPAKTFTPIHVWIVSLPTKEHSYSLEFTEGHTTIIFVQKGSVEIQGKELNLADVAIMDREGSACTIRAKEKNTSLLILSGEPIDEPIAARGPFVMNTQAELTQAMVDYQRGAHGFKHFD